MASNVTDNTGRSRFELEENGHVAYADYGVNDDVLSVRYVYAPEELRGTGAASRLMEGVADAARQRNLKIFPICGYAASWLRRHKDTHDLLA